MVKSDSIGNSARFDKVEFRSEGATLRGRVYSPPDASERSPAVVMAHGFSATINGMVADSYAEVFQDAGFAVLLYDHRNLGLSGGEPRQEINKWTQIRGYLDALSFLEKREDIDRGRIAVWGDSMSGAEAIIAGAIDERVAAVVGQVPACGDLPPGVKPDESLRKQLKERLRLGGLGGVPANTSGPLPVVSSDQHRAPSLLTPLTAFRWFIEYGGRFGTLWENWGTRAAPAATIPLHPMLYAHLIDVPLLMLIATDDEMPGASDKVSQQVFELAPGPKERIELDGGHFGLVYHPSAEFEESSRAQRDFLRKYLS